jgi:hypothetical protein
VSAPGAVGVDAAIRPSTELKLRQLHQPPAAARTATTKGSSRRERRPAARRALISGETDSARESASTSPFTERCCKSTGSPFGGKVPRTERARRRYSPGLSLEKENSPPSSLGTSAIVSPSLLSSTTSCRAG